MGGGLDLVGLAALKPGCCDPFEFHAVAIDGSAHSPRRSVSVFYGNSAPLAYGNRVRARRLRCLRFIGIDENVFKVLPARSFFHSVLPILWRRPEPRLPQSRSGLWLRPPLAHRGSRVRDRGGYESTRGVIPPDTARYVGVRIRQQRSRKAAPVSTREETRQSGFVIYHS